MRRRVLIFGTGLFYKNRKEYLNNISYRKAEIIGFLDNNAENIWMCDGLTVMHPYNITSLDFDIVLLMSKSADEMRAQLMKLGVDCEKIYDWDVYVHEMIRGTFQFYCGFNSILPKEKVLVLSTKLDYNGGTMAAVYAVKALQQRGVNAILAASDGNELYIQEIVANGVNVIICPGIYEFGLEEQLWISQFDIVLVNVLQMMPCAVKISKIKPVLWWIHEPSYFYPIYTKRFSEDIKNMTYKSINVKAVSRIAQNAFNDFCSNQIKSILPLGIPDQLISVENRDSSKVVFALIGSIEPNKAQADFLNAIRNLPDRNKENVEFWIIGSIVDKEYFEILRNIADKEKSVHIKGFMTQDQIAKAYEQIDIVVCPSYEETFSIVVSEGLMYAKPCIVSDTTGISEYISDGKNGFIIKAGDILGLSEKLMYFIDNRECIKYMGVEARKTYEENFTMEIFGECLEKYLIETMDKHR